MRMIPDYPGLIVEREGKVAIVTINRPQALNAINQEVMQSLHEIFGHLIEDGDILGIIITGSGDKAFAAGADIKDFSFDENVSADLSSFGHQTFRRIETSTFPVIAAVNGFALGGGCELAMACHIRIASEKAQFGQPEINLGLIPGYGGTQRLPQLVGRGRALELLLTGKVIDAAEAYRIGLVNQLVADGEALPAARKMMQSITVKAPLAASRIIQLVDAHYWQPEAANAMEVEKFVECFQTEDAREGVSAFLEKRKPDFKGK